MKITIQEARTRLASVGIELGQPSREKTGPKSTTHFRMTTPVGNQVSLPSQDVIGLLRDLGMLGTAV